MTNTSNAAITLNTNEVAPALEALEPRVRGTEKTITYLEDRAGRIVDSLKENPASDNLLKELGITLSVLNLALDAQGKALENEKNYWEWTNLFDEEDDEEDYDEEEDYGEEEE